jgi:hypothetical protein
MRKNLIDNAQNKAKVTRGVIARITLKWSAFIGYDAWNSNKVPQERG